MRSLAIFVVILLIIIAAAGMFVVLTTPHGSAPGRISPALIHSVPASAQWFAIIPQAAGLDARLQANPVTRAALEKWRSSHPLPQPWMLGNADMIVWKSDVLHYIVGLDPFRAFIVRVSGHNEITTLPTEATLDTTTVAQINDFVSKLPPGNALMVQRENARGSFPPIDRPAVSSVEVTPDDIRLTSIAHHRGDGGAAVTPSPSFPSVVSFPNGAILSASFTTPPRIIAEMNRLFGAKVSDLFADGGMLCIYDVDFRKLLPRPLGVIVVPDSPKRRADVASLGDIIRTGERNGMLLLSFDHSIDQYQKDVFEQPVDVGNEWTLRIDAPRLVPILNEFGQNLGARLVAPRLFRSARDLDQWLSGLEQAKLIDAAASADSGSETLRVRIAAK